MDDRNGDCFEHHEDLYGDVALNTSDSEHECLKDYLLEPRDSLRNVPCLGNEVADGSHIGNQNTSIGNVNYENSVNSTDERTEEDGIPPNCVQDSCSSTALTTNSDDEEKNGEYFSPVHSEDLSEPVTSEKARDSEGTIYKEETEEEENSSETSLAVQRSDDNEKSTKYSNNRLEDDAAAGLEDASKIDELDTKSEVEINDVEVGNGHSADIQSPPIKARNSASRGRKRKSAGDTETRGRPASTRKEKHPVTYQSQISPDQNGIKIRIKKSSTATTKVQRTYKRGKKRRGKKGSNTDDEISTDSESNKRVRWGDAVLSEGDDDGVGDNEEEYNGEQSVWGEQMPTEILGKIFFLCTQEEGCLPFLIRMARVCKLWREAAMAPSLWHTIDFSLPYVKQKYKNVDQLRWLCENRLRKVQELSMGVWKHSFYQQAMDLVADYCPDLKGLNLMGWKGLLPDHLKNVLANCQQLARLDLSYINTDSTTSKGFVSPVSISHLTQTLGSRLTHLTLANNKLAGIPQLITAISTHCPNLEVLDLSNVRTYANTTAPLHIEKLQEGCQKLRVLRVTNSQVTLSTASLTEQVASPGFPALEELSVAGTSMDGMCFTTVIDDNAIERILKTSQKLRLLDVRGCVRVTDSSLVRVPAWDLEHLFLSGCYVTRLTGSGLELIAQKWSHSLVEVDLAWSTATQALDLAVSALAERGAESPLRVLNLCGSSVSFNPVKAVLMHCPNLNSLNLSSCRALPRGIKRLYEGRKVAELRESLEEKSEAEKAKEEEKAADDEDTQENESAQAECGSASSGTIN